MVDGRPDMSDLLRVDSIKLDFLFIFPMIKQSE